MATDVSGSGLEDQDQSELFDEDRLQLDGSGSPSEMKTFEELPDVLDLTQAEGDSDDDAALIGEDLGDDEIIALEIDAADADADRGDAQGEAADIMPGAYDQGDSAEAGEVELVYAGDLDDVVEETSETDLEAETLADDDIDELGYGAAQAAGLGGPVPDGLPRNPTKFEIALRGHVWALTRDGRLIHEYGHAERAVHEAAELARELRRTGEPAVVYLHPAEGKTIEITDNERPLPLPEEHSAVIPDRSEDG